MHTISSYQAQLRIIDRDREVWICSTFGGVVLALAKAIREQGDVLAHALAGGFS